jgi:hypothetical protein
MITHNLSKLHRHYPAVAGACIRLRTGTPRLVASDEMLQPHERQGLPDGRVGGCRHLADGTGSRSELGDLSHGSSATRDRDRERVPVRDGVQEGLTHSICGNHGARVSRCRLPHGRSAPAPAHGSKVPPR